MTSQRRSQNSNMLLAFLTLLGVIALVALVGFFMLRKGPEIIQGQAEATEYRVSSKVPGRMNLKLKKENKSRQEIHLPSSKLRTFWLKWHRHRLLKPQHRHKTKKR